MQRYSVVFGVNGRWGFMRMTWWLGLAALIVGGCESVRWTEVPGSPVAFNHVANLDADEQFIQSLAASRRAQTIPEPIVTPSLQRQLRAIADMLQRGEISLAQARRASERWGSQAYHRDVDAWVLDCARGRDITLPSALVNRPVAVISYASAHHRPPTDASVRCATLVVTANGSDAVQMTGLK